MDKTKIYKFVGLVWCLEINEIQLLFTDLMKVKIKYIIILFFLFVMNGTMISQADSIKRIEIISRTTYDYREGDLIGYRTNLDSTCLKLDKGSKNFMTDTFYNYDKIVFKDESFEDYEYSNDVHIYRSISGISLIDIDDLLFELNASNYKISASKDEIYISDSLKIVIPFSILIPEDFDFLYLDMDSLFFIRLLKLKLPDNHEINNDGAMIDEFLEKWISDNETFRYISYEHSIIVRIHFLFNEIVELYHTHPGRNNCKWRFSNRHEEFYVFNPFVNEIIYKAMDSRFGSSKNKLLDFKNIQTRIGDY